MPYCHHEVSGESARRRIDVIVSLVMLLCFVADCFCGSLAAEEKAASTEQTASTSKLHLPFWDAQDVVNPLGPLKFQA